VNQQKQELPFKYFYKFFFINKRTTEKSWLKNDAFQPAFKGRL